MSANKLLAFYGLKWNPFTPDVPTEGLLCTQRLEQFAWRLEQLVSEGGFALITGDPGSGKSVSLRLLDRHLSRLRDVMVAVVSRPQSGVSDFYRELGDLFGVNLAPHNRWAGFKMLRERWKAHLESTLMRPVLLIDEAQEMSPTVLSELRILSSAAFDVATYLTVVLSGDSRLINLLRHEDLAPLASRIRTRLPLEYATREHLLALLKHVTHAAGSASLMTDSLMQALADHAMGNCRLLMTMASELLVEAMAREQPQLDEKLYLEVFQVPASGAKDKRDGRRQATGRRGGPVQP
jgi:type II secretory pathway predicted ATPase ExeA